MITILLILQKIALVYVSERILGLTRLIRLFSGNDYRQVYNVRCTKFQHLKDYRTVLRLSLPNPLKPAVKSRMKM